MNRNHKSAFVSLLLVVLVCAPQVARAEDGNLLNDPGFETRLAPGQGGWRLFEISLFSKNHARSGQQSMFNGGFSRTVAFPPYFIGNDSGSYQEQPATAGSRWRLTGYALAPEKLKGTPAFGLIQVSFFDAGGKDLGTVETAGTDTRAQTSEEVNSKSAVGEWIFLDTGVATAPAGTASIQAFTIYVDYSGTATTQGVYFDDLALCAIDEDEETGGCGTE